MKKSVIDATFIHKNQFYILPMEDMITVLVSQFSWIRLKYFHPQLFD